MYSNCSSPVENGNSYLPEMLQPENDSESRLNDHDDLHILDFGKSVFNRFCFTFLSMYITYGEKIESVVWSYCNQGQISFWVLSRKIHFKASWALKCGLNKCLSVLVLLSLSEPKASTKITRRIFFIFTKPTRTVAQISFSISFYIF